MTDNNLVHADPRPTETAALEKVAPHLKKMKRHIYDAVAASGADGLTPDELPCFLINTCRRRFTDLWKEGLIRPTALTRKNARGNPCTVWVIGSDPNLSIRQATKDETIKLLRGDLRRLLAARYVFLPKTVSGEYIYANTVARPGLYEAHRNEQGAVSVRASNGKLLGVKPDEFVDVGPIVS